METKQQVKSALRQSYGDVIYSLSELSDEVFFAPRATEKWSPAEILGHLILSSKTVAKAMSTPKLILRTTFGINKDRETNFDSIITTYKETLKGGLKAPKSYRYEGVQEKGRTYLMDSWSKELNTLLALIDKWSEKDLDKYQLPHPAIGKLTVREILLFTDFHTRHHHDQIKEVFQTT